MTVGVNISQYRTTTSDVYSALLVRAVVTDASWFRDNTQIILLKNEIDGYLADLEETFVVTVVEEGDTVRLIGSPVVIMQVRGWLLARGVEFLGS